MRRCRARGGFTLVEILVAMTLIGAVLLPLCAWLYKSEASRSAQERLLAVNLLEDRMNRAFLLRIERDVSGEIRDPIRLKFDIRVVNRMGETRLLGTARNFRGLPIAEMEVDYFHRGPP